MSEDFETNADKQSNIGNFMFELLEKFKTLYPNVVVKRPILEVIDYPEYSNRLNWSNKKCYIKLEIYESSHYPCRYEWYAREHETRESQVGDSLENLDKWFELFNSDETYGLSETPDSEKVSDTDPSPEPMALIPSVFAVPSGFNITGEQLDLFSKK